MATLSRIRVGWAGAGAVGGGVSTFHSANSDPSAFLTAIHAFMTAVAVHLASGTTIVFPAVGDTIDEATGQINGSWSGTAPAQVLTSGSSNFAAGAGARVVWITDGITNGRRVKGSTYLVPLAGNLWDSQGGPADGALSVFRTAASTLRAADGGSMRIYTRPVKATAGPPPREARDGKAHVVVGSDVPDVASWLRSRRT